jgi:hypothetical protein
VKTPRPHFLYPSVVPDLPEPATYLPLLQEMHERHWYSNFGPLVRQFEHLLLASFGRPGETCVTACNATAGLSAALLATGRTGPVLLPAFTFPASLGAVRAAGMNPIVLDIDVEDWTLSVPLLAAALAGTRDAVVMLTAPFGLNRSFSAHLALCKYYGAPVVIDNAAGLGPPSLRFFQCMPPNPSASGKAVRFSLALIMTPICERRSASHWEHMDIPKQSRGDSTGRCRRCMLRWAWHNLTGSRGGWSGDRPSPQNICAD